MSSSSKQREYEEDAEMQAEAAAAAIDASISGPSDLHYRSPSSAGHPQPALPQYAPMPAPAGVASPAYPYPPPSTAPGDGMPEYVGVQPTTHEDAGSFNGGNFTISHRDSNAILTVQLAMACPLRVKPGSMICMSPTVTLKGTVNFDMRKFIAGIEKSESVFTGPGEVVLAPGLPGDICTLRLNTNRVTDDPDSPMRGMPERPWNVGKGAFLACEQNLEKKVRFQNLSKTLFSGEGIGHVQVWGRGCLWVSSYGAIVKKDLVDGETYIVDNGHLVAWNCEYNIERVASGGVVSNVSAKEGLVCRFKGPGTVLLQTRDIRVMADALYQTIWKKSRR